MATEVLQFYFWLQMYGDCISDFGGAAVLFFNNRVTTILFFSTEALQFYI